MRKALLGFLLGLLAAGVAQADEMVIRLQSGNAVVVRYEGTIHGVELRGKSDAIAGLDMPAAHEPTIARQTEVARPEPLTLPGMKRAADQEGNQLRLGWSDPIDETR